SPASCEPGNRVKLRRNHAVNSQADWNRAIHILKTRAGAGEVGQRQPVRGRQIRIALETIRFAVLNVEIQLKTCSGNELPCAEAALPPAAARADAVEIENVICVVSRIVHRIEINIHRELAFAVDARWASVLRITTLIRERVDGAEHSGLHFKGRFAVTESQ